MKLTFLEDGVLDYKGQKRTLATPEAIPNGALKPGPELAPLGHHFSLLEKLKLHFRDCPQCSKDKLCTTGEQIVKTSK